MGSACSGSGDAKSSERSPLRYAGKKASKELVDALRLFSKPRPPQKGESRCLHGLFQLMHLCDSHYGGTREFQQVRDGSLAGDEPDTVCTPIDRLHEDVGMPREQFLNTVEEVVSCVQSVLASAIHRILQARDEADKDGAPFSFRKRGNDLLNEFSGNEVEESSDSSEDALGNSVTAVNWKDMYDKVHKRFSHRLKAGDTMADVVRMSVRAGLALLFVLSGRRRHFTVLTSGPGRGKAGTVVGPRSFYVPMLNALFACLGSTICNPSRGMETVMRVEAELESFGHCLSLLGIVCPTDLEAPAAVARSSSIDHTGRVPWFGALPYVTMDGSSKATMMYCSCLLGGQRKLTLAMLPRTTAIDSTMKICRRDKIFDPASAFRTSKVFPFFVSEVKGMESGEGHGPRKEFFDICGGALFQPFGHGEDITPLCHVWTKSGSPIVMLEWIDLKKRVDVKKGGAVTLKHDLLEQCDTLPIVDATWRDKKTMVLQLTQAMPQSATDVNITYHDHNLPCFAPTTVKSSQYVWFNQNLPQAMTNDVAVDFSRSLDANTPDWWLQRFYFVGWLMAQAIANGLCLPVPVHPVLFKMLHEWPTYTPSEADLVAFDAAGDDGYAKTFADIRAMPQETFMQLLEADGADANTTKEDYISDMVAETLKGTNEPYVSSCHLALQHSGLLASPAWQHASPLELADAVFGRSDDGVSDFSMTHYFRLILDDELTAHEYSDVYREIFYRVLEAGVEDYRTGAVNAQRKRKLLKFITGRTTLPSVPQREYIRVELPLAPMTARDFDKVLTRLPTSHSCDNTIELPHYLEAFLFAKDSPWYGATASLPSKLIVDEDKEGAWAALTAQQRAVLEDNTVKVLVEKLAMAVDESNTYELDEGVGGSGALSAPGFSPSSSSLVARADTSVLIASAHSFRDADAAQRHAARNGTGADAGVTSVLAPLTIPTVESRTTSRQASPRDGMEEGSPLQAAGAAANSAGPSPVAGAAPRRQSSIRFDGNASSVPQTNSRRKPPVSPTVSGQGSPTIGTTSAVKHSAIHFDDEEEEVPPPPAPAPPPPPAQQPPPHASPSSGAHEDIDRLMIELNFDS